MICITMSARRPQYLSLTLPLPTAPGSPACLQPWCPAAGAVPSRAGSRNRRMPPDSIQPSGTFSRTRGKRMVCSTPSPIASAAPVALGRMLARMHAAQRHQLCCMFSRFLEQRTALNNYAVHLPCDRIQRLLVATLLEVKVTRMLSSATARTGPREDKISPSCTVPPSFSRLASLMDLL